MLYRRLGNSGLKLSAFSLGSWETFSLSVDQDTTAAIMLAAYEAGINYFDGAESYNAGGAEDFMGQALRKHGWRRDTYILSGKVSVGLGAVKNSRPTQKGLSRKHMFECCEATLHRYGVDYLDLFFCHRPDPDTPLEEIVWNMNLLIQRGRILYWGTSEFAPEDLIQLHEIARRLNLIGPLMEQTGYNLLGRERVDKALLPLFTRYGMGATVYCPLAGGLLTGKYLDGIPDGTRGASRKDWVGKEMTPATVQKLRALQAVAANLGCNLAQLALAWLLKNPHVSTAILGATRPDQIANNVQACAVVDKFDGPLMDKIEAILANKP